MKQKFSKSWKASKQPRKKRKYSVNAPLNIRHKLMSSNLSKELRRKYKKRNFPVRKGDEVKVMRGKFKGKAGKVNRVDLTKLRVSVDGLQIQKKDGTKVNVYFSPSNIQIQELDLSDSKREKALKKIIWEKKEPAEKKTEEKGKIEVKKEKEKTGEKNAPKEK